MFAFLNVDAEVQAREIAQSRKTASKFEFTAIMLGIAGLVARM